MPDCMIQCANRKRGGLPSGFVFGRVQNVEMQVLDQNTHTVATRWGQLTAWRMHMPFQLDLRHHAL